MFQNLPCRPPPMTDLRNQALKPLMLRALRQPKVGPPPAPPAPPLHRPARSRAWSPCVPPSWLPLLLPAPLAERYAHSMLCRMAQAWLRNSGGAMPRFDALLAGARHGHCHRVCALRQPHLERLGSVAKQGLGTRPQSPCFTSVILLKRPQHTQPLPTSLFLEPPGPRADVWPRKGAGQCTPPAHTLGLGLD